MDGNLGPGTCLLKEIEALKSIVKRKTSVSLRVKERKEASSTLRVLVCSPFLLGRSIFWVKTELRKGEKKLRDAVKEHHLSSSSSSSIRLYSSFFFFFFHFIVLYGFFKKAVDFFDAR